MQECTSGLEGLGDPSPASGPAATAGSAVMPSAPGGGLPSSGGVGTHSDPESSQHQCCLESSQQPPRLVIFVSTGAANKQRRQACRKSWFRYKASGGSEDGGPPLLSPAARDSVQLCFVAAREAEGQMAEEMAQHGDIVLVDVAEGYQHLWRRALCFLAWLEAGRQAQQQQQQEQEQRQPSHSGGGGGGGDPAPAPAPGSNLGDSGVSSSRRTSGGEAHSDGAGRPAGAGSQARHTAAGAGSHGLQLEFNFEYDYVMHADDDSFVRLDLLLPLLPRLPRQRLYWGYIWDGTGQRVTQPIRNPANKSHMPVEQYPLDYYPPFASGCGFMLSRDLALALLAQPLPDYRLLDPPFGIHLCGPPQYCVAPGGPVAPLHDERVRPYRPLPTFRPTTLVQHYLRPEEMRPFYGQALESARNGIASDAAPLPTTPASCGPRHLGPAAAAGAAAPPGQQQQQQQQELEGKKASQEPAANVGPPPAGTSQADVSGPGCGADEGSEGEAGGAPEQLYSMLVQMGLLRR